MIKVQKIYHTKKKGDLRAKLLIVTDNSIRSYAVKCGKRNTILSLQDLGIEVVGIDLEYNTVTIKTYPSNKVHVLSKFNTLLTTLRR